MNFMSNTSNTNKYLNIDNTIDDHHSFLSSNESISSGDGNVSDNVLVQPQNFHSPSVSEPFQDHTNVLCSNNSTVFLQYYLPPGTNELYSNNPTVFSYYFPPVSNQLPNNGSNQLPSYSVSTNQTDCHSSQVNLPFCQTSSNSNVYFQDNTNQSCDTGVPVSGCVPSNFSNYLFPSNCCFFVGYSDGTVKQMEPDFVFVPQKHGVYCVQASSSSFNLIPLQINPRVEVNSVKSLPNVIESYPKSMNTLTNTRSRTPKQNPLKSKNLRNSIVKENSSVRNISLNNTIVDSQEKTQRRYGFRSKQIKIDRTHSNILRMFKDVLAKPDQLVRGNDTVRVHIKKYRCLTVVEDALKDITNVPDLNVIQLAAPISKKNAKQKKGFIIYLKIDDETKIDEVVQIFKSYGLNECVVAPERTKQEKESPIGKEPQTEKEQHFEEFDEKDSGPLDSQFDKKVCRFSSSDIQIDKKFENEDCLNISDNDLSVSLTPPQKARKASCGG